MRNIESYELAIQVRNSDGILSIPGAAEPEDWHYVLTELDPTEVDDAGPLTGWGGWKRLARVVDEDGFERWYFLE